MPTVFLEASTTTITPPQRKRWTRTECAALENAGLLDLRWMELVEGDLINKMGKKRPHSIAECAMQAWLQKTFGTDYVQFDAPIDVAPEDSPTNEPVLDLIVLRVSFRSLPDRNPQPQDLRLVVEVSDSTLGFDLNIKAALYARAGIVEYWVLDIPARRLIVHRDPVAGGYRSVVAYAENEAASPLDCVASFPVSSALPPRA